MTTKTNIKKLQEMAANGKSFSALVTYLTVTDEAANKAEAEKMLQEAGIEKGKRIGITEAMYDYLAEKPRTEDELHQWIVDNGTENTLRWEKSHQKVRELANRIHEMK